MKLNETLDDDRRKQTHSGRGRPSSRLYRHRAGHTLYYHRITIVLLVYYNLCITVSVFTIAVLLLSYHCHHITVSVLVYSLHVGYVNNMVHNVCIIRRLHADLKSNALPVC